MSEFSKELEVLINRYCKDGDTNTPDFILSNYLDSCLRAYEIDMAQRDDWHGVDFNPVISTIKK